ncbi:THUMP domain-containing protein 3-like [Sceloporus undulatus]|uniref:THUMP domain-containing protein 3-like n=1 Tax=Sceloporus undulatus TaxID=8520 RepID=UPI001C4AB922|nr:THUMP domain-containing protein 3-like [Sceloporus undulatus]XP_042305853.1 THUMP domain-containing protein 3-like [Sceloporus undulatus]
MSEVGEVGDMLSEVTLDNACKTLSDNYEAIPDTKPRDIIVTIGATVPTGFEVTAADEVQEKLGSKSRISKDRGKIYFDIPAISLPQVHQLRSVDNLFVVVQEFKDYEFKETKVSIIFYSMFPSIRFLKDKKPHLVYRSCLFFDVKN